MNREQLRAAIALEISNAINDQLLHKAQTKSILETRTDRILALLDANASPRADVTAIEHDKRTR